MSCTHILKRIGSFEISLLSGRGEKLVELATSGGKKKQKKKKLEEADPFL
jgi:hypothetical protein